MRTGKVSCAARTRKNKERRSWRNAKCGFVERISAHAQAQSLKHTHTHTQKLFCLAPLPSGVSVSKWEPLSGAQWACGSVHVMGSWLGVCMCVCFLFMCGCWMSVEAEGHDGQHQAGLLETQRHGDRLTLAESRTEHKLLGLNCFTSYSVTTPKCRVCVRFTAL